MRLKSQIDLCFFIRVVDVPAAMITTSLKDTLASIQYKKLSPEVWSKEALGPDFDQVVRVEILFHETYHYWQGISYPYLIWYSFHAWMELIDGFRSLDGSKPLLSQRIEAKTLDRLNRRYIYELSKDGVLSLVLSDAISDATNHSTLSELDLIEAATSIAQWRLFAADGAFTCKSFMRWTKRNAAYTQAFCLAANFFPDKELLLSAFPFLVAASFSSTQPVRTFFFLLNELADRRDLADLQKSAESTFDWPTIFDDLLDSESFDRVFDRYEAISSLEGCAYLRLDLEEVVSFRWSGKLGHPITHSDAERWAKLISKHESWRLVMGFPELVQKHTNLAVAEFQPPLTLYRYDLGTRTLVIPTGDFRRMGLHAFAGDSTRAFLNDFLVMYSVGRRLSGKHYSESFRLCGHFQCPNFEGNLCNTWPFIPQDYLDCSFDTRLSYVLRTYLKRGG